MLRQRKFHTIAEDLKYGLNTKSIQTNPKIFEHLSQESSLVQINFCFGLGDGLKPNLSYAFYRTTHQEAKELDASKIYGHFIKDL